MPKQHKPGNFKQKNKSFKGTSKKATKEKAGRVSYIIYHINRS